MPYIKPVCCILFSFPVAWAPAQEVEALPGTGPLTWQGDLPINVPLIIQGRHASTGSLNGELPGTSVRVEVVEPAGVVIVQMPGAGVGWKNMVLNSPYQRQTRIVIRWTETR